MGTAETTLRKGEGERVRTMYGFERKKMSVFEEIAYAIRLDGEKWLFLHGGSLDVQKAWSMGLLVFIH